MQTKKTDMAMMHPASQMLKREDYKTVKHMDRQQLTAYLSRIYRRGYEAGLKELNINEKP